MGQYIDVSPYYGGDTVSTHHINTLHTYTVTIGCQLYSSATIWYF